MYVRNSINAVVAINCLLKRVELALAEKGANEKVRIEGDRSSMERRFFDVIKIKLQKKRAVVDAAREVGFFRTFAVSST